MDSCLKDSESTRLMSPQCAVHEIAEALSFALASLSYTMKIGAAWRAVAVTEFDMQIAQQRLERVLQNDSTPPGLANRGHGQP